jgi:hypothetical protein
MPKTITGQLPTRKTLGTLGDQSAYKGDGNINSARKTTAKTEPKNNRLNKAKTFHLPQKSSKNPKTKTHTSLI